MPETDDTVATQVVIDSADPAGFREAVKGLESAGMQVNQVLEQIGMVTGSIAAGMEELSHFPVFPASNRRGSINCRRPTPTSSSHRHFGAAASTAALFSSARKMQEQRRKRARRR